MASLSQSGVAGAGRRTPKMDPKGKRSDLMHPAPTKVGSTKKGKVYKKAGTSESKALGIKGMAHVAKGMRASSQAVVSMTRLPSLPRGPRPALLAGCLLRPRGQ